MSNIPKILQEIADACENDWQPKELRIMAYLANPVRENQRALAAELAGLSNKPKSEWTDSDEQKMIYQEQCISRIKNLKGFKSDMARVATVIYIEYDLEVDRANLRDATLSPKKHPEIANSIIKARGLYYKRRGLLIEKVESKNETKVTVDLSEDLTDEQTRLIAESLLVNGGATE